MSRIDEIRAREQEATPGPWDSGGFIIITLLDNAPCSNDRDFIAHSRQDIPFLLDKLDETEQIWEGRRENLLHDRNLWKSRCERLEAELAGYREAEKDGRLHVMPVAFGQHLWQAWNGEEVREWAVDMIQMLHCGDCYIGCVDIIDGEYGEDYEVFDMTSVGQKLKLIREDAEAELQWRCK